MWYSKKVIELFLDPQNVGSLDEPSAVGEAGDPRCGDYLKIYIKVNGDVIEECTFEVLGCCAAIASSSMTTILAKGEKLEEAARITAQKIVDALGGLPEPKIHCSVLGAAALKSALDNYYLKRQSAVG